MMLLRSDVRSATALFFDLRLERGPVNDRLPRGFDRFDHAAIKTLAALFRAYLYEADRFSVRPKQRFRRFKVQSEDVRHTERISFSFAARIASMSLMNSSVSF